MKTRPSFIAIFYISKALLKYEIFVDFSDIFFLDNISVTITIAEG